MAQTPDARLREISLALVKDLHAFVREVEPKTDEFEKGCAFIVGLGQSTSAAKNGVSLASDILGASGLINLLQDQSGNRERSKTDSALLGPFWRMSAPECELGASIARGEEASVAGQALWVDGQVRNDQGLALGRAVVDVWQASPVGLYENQDERQPDMNLRGCFRTNDQGRFNFRSVRPAGYPVPVDGPCGDLLRGQNRHPFRPAHLHSRYPRSTHRNHRWANRLVFCADCFGIAADPRRQIAGPCGGYDSPFRRSAHGADHY